MKLEIRKLRPDEIEVRIAQINERGATLLLYKDARVDQKILDETFGVFGWQRTHQLIGDRLYCTISIWDDANKQWIVKQDVGTESYTEKEKGQASDSFKRAGFNVGIGRELYSAPFIWVSKDRITIEKKGSDRYVTNDKFEVSEIGYDDKGEINSLTIINPKTKAVIYKLGEEKKGFDFDAYKKKLAKMNLDELRREYVEVNVSTLYTDKTKQVLKKCITEAQEKLK